MYYAVQSTRTQWNTGGLSRRLEGLIALDVESKREVDASENLFDSNILRLTVVNGAIVTSAAPDDANFIAFSKLLLEYTILPVLNLEHLNIPSLQIHKIATNIISMYVNIQTVSNIMMKFSIMSTLNLNPTSFFALMSQF